MRKKAIFMLTFVMLLSLMSLNVFAQSYKPDKIFYVNYTGNSVEDNFSGSEISSAIGNLQSGDDVTIDIEVRNTAAKDSATFYMRNQVLKSLEETRNGAKGGAYSYYLTYKAPNGTTTELFSSDRVGGLDSKGLLGATDALKDYFRLGEIAAGGKGIVTLQVIMEGESTVNSYQNTLGKLNMQFAVEKGGTNYIPSTGESGTIVIWGALMLLCLAVIIFLGKKLLRSIRQKGEEKT